MTTAKVEKSVNASSGALNIVWMQSISLHTLSILCILKL